MEYCELTLGSLCTMASKTGGQDDQQLSSSCYTSHDIGSLKFLMTFTTSIVGSEYEDIIQHHIEGTTSKHNVQCQFRHSLTKDIQARMR